MLSDRIPIRFPGWKVTTNNRTINCSDVEVKESVSKVSRNVYISSYTRFSIQITLSKGEECYYRKSEEQMVENVSLAIIWEHSRNQWWPDV